MTRGPGRRSRRLAVASATVIVLVVAGTAFALVHAGSSSQPGRVGTTTTTPRTSSTTTTTTAPPPSTTTTTTAPPGIGHYSVATTAFVVGVPGVPATESQVRAKAWYPVATPPQPFPLLVFSQGYAQPVAAYTTLITDWASAGFVVAAPTYPHTTPTAASTSPLDETDIEHHPADLRAVIETLDDATTQPPALQGLLDTAELGLVGQSDGGDVSLAVADNACCRIGTVGAVAVLSGAEFRGFGGAYFPKGDPAPPLLVVQGDADTVNAPVCSLQVYDAAPPPKWYLDLLGATHLGPYTEPTAWEPVVAAVTTDFFDAKLAHDSSSTAAMQAAGNVSGTATLSDAASAPPASGSCLDAP